MTIPATKNDDWVTFPSTDQRRTKNRLKRPTRRLILLLCLSCFTVGAMASAATDPKEVADLYRRSMFQEALPLFRTLVAERPDDGILLHRLGVCLQMTGKQTEGTNARRKAIPLLAQQTRKDGTPILAYYYLVGDEELAGDKAAAEALTRKVVDRFRKGDLAISNGEEFFQMASLLDRASDKKAALNLFKKARAAFASGKAPNRRYYSDTLVRLGNSEFTAKKPAEALVLFREAQSVDPKNAGAAYVAGVVSDSQGKVEEAETAYLHAIELDAGHFYAHYNLANLLARKGDGEKAMATFNKTLDLAPTDDDRARTYLAMARLAEAMGKNDEAAENYGSLGKIRPSQAAALSGKHARGKALAASGKLAEAVKLLREVRDQAPDLPIIRAEIASLLSKQQDYDGAASELLSALALAPGNGQLYLALGRTYKSGHRLDEARDAFSQAAEMEGTKEEAEKELRTLEKR